MFFSRKTPEIMATLNKKNIKILRVAKIKNIEEANKNLLKSQANFFQCKIYIVITIWANFWMSYKPIFAQQIQTVMFPILDE